MRIIFVRTVWRLCAFVLTGMGLAACAQDTTGPQSPTAEHPVIALPVVEVVTCRYGGEYPACWPPPPPSDEDIGPGGGGTSNPPSDSTETCDPARDPDCEKPLTSTDSATIRIAIQVHVRPDSTIADTANRRKCKEMLDRFLQAFNEGAVFRGGSNTGHYGETYKSRVHFDPWLLNSAASGNVADMRELANSALHEGAHLLDFEHPNGETNGIYTDPPFNLLPPGPGVCIR